jgi:hypothetical protein
MRTRETTAHRRCRAGACRMPRTLPNPRVSAEDRAGAVSARHIDGRTSAQRPLAFGIQGRMQEERRQSGCRWTPVIPRQRVAERGSGTERTGRVVDGVGVMDAQLGCFDGPAHGRPKGDWTDKFGSAQPLVLALRHRNRSTWWRRRPLRAMGSGAGGRLVGGAMPRAAQGCRLLRRQKVIAATSPRRSGRKQSPDQDGKSHSCSEPTTRVVNRRGHRLAHRRHTAGTADTRRAHVHEGAEPRGEKDTILEV